MENGDVDMVVEIVDGILDSVGKRRSEGFFSAPSISMVPSRLRDLSPTSFTPQVVSIGPFHRSDKNLLAFEDRKASYVHVLLQSLDSPPEITLKECAQVVARSLQEIKFFYSNIKTCTDVELAKMMVMDACFILQVIRILSGSGAAPQNIFIDLRTIHDLVLIENQIPLSILQLIFNNTILKSQPTARLIDLLPGLLRVFNVFETTLTAKNVHCNPFDHILGILDRCYCRSRIESAEASPCSAIHSVIELDRARVIFKPNSNENWLTAIEFKASTFACGSWSWSKPALKIPVLRIDNFTELILRNLIAYEFLSGRKRYVTSYAMAMDMLVDTQEDVAKLMESKVLLSRVGSNERVANMMNNLCKELPLTSFYYSDQWQQLGTHYNSYWPKNIAGLKPTYFSIPWNIIALLAGIVLFALTLVQTIFTVNPA